jgi:pilus assembly protein CpaE
MDELIKIRLSGGEPDQRDSLQTMLRQVSPTSLTLLEDSSATGEGAAGVDAIAIVVGDEPATAIDQIKRATAGVAPPRVLAFRHEWPLPLMRQLLQAGAAELLQMPPDEHELDFALMKLREARRRESRNGAGRIYSVAGLAGGAGLTTVAANLALAFRHTLKQRVALIDLDLQRGGVNVCLHLDPNETIVALTSEVGRLDSIRLEAALTKHPAVVYVLAAPRRIEEADLVTDDVLGAVLELMRQLFDVVVIDCGRRVSEVAVSAWRRSTQLLYVTDQHLWSARRVQRFTAALASFGLNDATLRLVLNRFLHSNGTGREAIMQAAKLPVFATIPRDDRLADLLELHNEDLWRLAPSSRLAAAFEDLARRLEVPDARPEASRLIERLWAAVGARA